MRSFACICSLALLSGMVFGQAAETTPTADVHVSPKTLRPNMRGGVLRAGRYDVLTATIVDLIRTAYSFDADKALGGPSWLDTDHFDVRAKAPAGATPETAELMLQVLLADPTCSSVLPRGNTPKRPTGFSLTF
jgi:hypothetical protein